MAFQQMTATDAVAVIQSLEFIADGGAKKLNDSVGQYAQALADKKFVGVANEINELFGAAAAEEYRVARGLANVLKKSSE